MVSPDKTADEKPFPMPSTIKMHSGPAAGQLFNNPVSLYTPSRFSPRNCADWENKALVLRRVRRRRKRLRMGNKMLGVLRVLGVLGVLRMLGVLRVLRVLRVLGVLGVLRMWVWEWVWGVGCGVT